MTRYQVYDFTNKKYLQRTGAETRWTCFKADAFLYDTHAEAQAFIDFWRPFTANEFRILPVTHRRAPLKASAGFAHAQKTV